MGKTRKTEQTQQIDPQLARESHALLNLLRLLGGAGYEPDRGVTTAAFTPKQESSFGMGDAMAAAFGFDVPNEGTMPETSTNDMGIEGYRASELFDESVDSLSDPYKAIMAKFYETFSDSPDYRQYTPRRGGKK